MVEKQRLYGLDEPINLAGRQTTIRQQHQDGKVSVQRVGDGTVLGKGAARALGRYLRRGRER